MTRENAVDATMADLRDLADRPGPESLGVSVDPATGQTSMWWGAEPGVQQGEDFGRGSVVLVSVVGGQVGDHTSQRTVVTHVVENPTIDFDTVMRDSAVSQALAEVCRDPSNPNARAAAVQALDSVTAAAPDWTVAYEGAATARSHPSGHFLDGTVVIVRSRDVQVGDWTHQENEVVHSLSPTIDGAAVLTRPEVVNSLIDVATRPGDRAAAAAFDKALSSELRGDLASSLAARHGYGTVHRRPGAGRTLRVENAIGMAVGHGVSSKTDFAQAALLGRRVRRSTKAVGRTTTRTARRMDRQDRSASG